MGVKKQVGMQYFLELIFEEMITIKKLIIILAILILILSGCGIAPDPPEPNGVVYRGFFVGVGKYENGWTLPSPAGNTEKLEDLFSQCGFGEGETGFEIIEKFTNYDATKENILNGISDIFYDADDNDVSYFYYMGHGGLKNGIPIITPTDYTGCICKSITVHELEEYLSMIAGTKVVFLETCHAGNFIDKNIILEPFTEFSLDLLNKEGYQVLASSAGNQYTWDSYSFNGSYFCRYLIEGCEDLQADINKDEIVDISELYQYIKFNVTKQTVQIYPNESKFPIVEY